MSESQLINPAVGCERFTTANGREWVRSEGLCLGRAKLLQRFQTELQFDTSISAVQQGIQACYEAYNSRRDVDGAGHLRKLMDGMDVLGTNRFRQAEVCALFYNAPGEDATNSSYDLVKEKVAAWGAVDAAFFTRTAYFLLASFWQRCQPTPPAAADPSPLPA